MDTDVIVVRHLDSLPSNVLAWEAPQEAAGALINGAFMAFEKQHPFMKACLEEFATRYNGGSWAENGPALLTRVWKNWPGGSSKSGVSVLHKNAFYMFNYASVNDKCFNDISKSNYNSSMNTLRKEAYVVHLNTKITGARISKLKEGTVCNYLLNTFCVLCNTLY